MGSIRPLITITILAIVGAYLYVQINSAPPKLAHGEAEAWQSPAGAPTLEPIAPPTAAGSQAPQWPANSTPAAPAPSTNAAAPASRTPSTQPAPSTSANAIPEMPAVPVLPKETEMGATTAAPPADALPSTPATSLPAAAPIARYGDPSAAGSTAASATNLENGASGIDHENAAAADSAMNAIGLTPRAPETPAATPLSPAPSTASSPSTPNAPPATAQSPPAVDRYGVPIGNSASAIAPTAPIAPVAQTPSPLAGPVEPTFTAAWPAVQTALERGELSKAHKMLSKWYGDDSLTPEDANKVETILGQLAGTVVYSTENQLEPARTVRPGESLDSIAKEYNVPWQLLAKINGVPTADAVQPGQQLKVVRGPFNAVVDIGRSQLTLMVDGRYAGKFPVTLAAGAVTEGNWLVDQKLTLPSTGAIPTSYAAQAPTSVDRAIILRDDAPPGIGAAVIKKLTIASSSSPAGAATSTPAIRMTPQDAEELSDILSVGSRIVVQR